jgi:hypothetical protein
MSVRGHVQGGIVVLDEPHALPEGAEVRVEIVSPELATAVADEEEQSLRDILLKYAGTLRDLPPDLAKNHHRYLYETPKNDEGVR